MNPPKDQYPNALEVIRQITNLTQGEDCIYRGESSINFGYPCSSTLYRQLKDEGFPYRNIPELLRQRQGELIEKIRGYATEGENDLERLMACQHKGGKTNLLDFSGAIAVSLYFTCFKDSDDDGRVIVKQKDTFCKLKTDNPLPSDKIVLLEPPQKLKRAMDQKGVLIHAPKGFLTFETSETVAIKAEWKQEILEHIEKEYRISYETIFDDMQGAIELQRQEDKKRIATATQSTTGIRGFVKPRNGEAILAMEYYIRLLAPAVVGFYKDQLNDQANVLIKSFTDAIIRDPQDAEAYYNRAVVHQSKPSPDYDQAFSDFNRAVELNPKFAEAYNNRGAAYATKSPPDYDKAIKDYVNAIKLNPSLAEAHYNRGIAYTKKSPPDFDLAVESYDKAIARDPKYFQAYLNRGIAHFSKSPPDYAKAILDFSCAIHLKPRYAEAYNNRGNVHRGKPEPDYERAIKDYNRAIEQNPKYVEAYLNRGLAHFLKPQHDDAQAISDINRAIKLDNNFAQAYFVRAHLFAEYGDCKKAHDDYESALRISPLLKEQYIPPELEKCIRVVRNEIRRKGKG